jgi:cell wall-associated NlpC family hydrolase
MRGKLQPERVSRNVLGSEVNVAAYVGLPYVAKGRSPEGIDCWGLVKLFYERELGLIVPSYVDEYVGPNDRLTVSQAIQQNIGKWKQTAVIQAGDMLLFSILGLPLHTGVYIGNNDFLHAFMNTDSCIERLNSVTWNRRLIGAYRWIRN